ncbi:histidine phosphatase family protein [Parasalinivibrio latis]|uniref:histidine phosphatase family protein n=1 Tax=Parasalinivibrio latis TaxID=2952610 RepID=UPI0030E2817B
MNFRTLNVTLLRHGRPEGENCLRGVTDFPLTTEGFRQMEMAVESNVTMFGEVISSPLHRCRHFAEQIASKRGLGLKIRNCWQEMNFGDWDGQSVEKLWRENPDFRRFQGNPWHSTVPRGEQTREFDMRVSNAWDDLLEQTISDTVLVVTHAGVIKQLLRQIWKMPEDSTYLSSLSLPYAARIDIAVYINGDEICPVVKWPS